MERAEVISSWIGDGVTEDTAYRPAIRDDHSGVYRVRDVTGSNNHIVTPNAQVVYIEADTAVMDAIEADDNYTILPGTREVIPEDVI